MSEQEHQIVTDLIKPWFCTHESVFVRKKDCNGNFRYTAQCKKCGRIDRAMILSFGFRGCWVPASKVPGGCWSVGEYDESVRAAWSLQQQELARKQTMEVAERCAKKATNTNQARAMYAPIETRYGGCIFRSRAEARWAVFLDSFKAKWEYEKQGYELPSGKYLCDFWLPEHFLWLEIKPKPPTTREIRCAEELSHATDAPIAICWGRRPLSIQDGDHKPQEDGGMKVYCWWASESEDSVGLLWLDCVWTVTLTNNLCITPIRGELSEIDDGGRVEYSKSQGLTTETNGRVYSIKPKGNPLLLRGIFQEEANVATEARFETFGLVQRSRAAH